MNNFIEAFKACKNSLLNLVNQNIEQQKEIKNISQFFSLIPNIINLNQKDAGEKDIFQDISQSIEDAVTQLQAYQKNKAEKIAADRLNSVRNVIHQNIIQTQQEQKTMLNNFIQEIERNITDQLKSIQGIINQNFTKTKEDQKLMLSGLSQEIKQDFNDKSRSITTLLLQPIKFPSKVTSFPVDDKSFLSFWVINSQRIASYINSDFFGNSIIIYNLGTTKSKKIIRKAHKTKVVSVCGLANSLLASSSTDCTIKIWAERRDRVRDPFDVIQVIYESSSYCTNLRCFAMDKFCSTSSNGEIKIWKKNSLFECEKKAKKHEGYIKSMLITDNKIVSFSGKSMDISDIDCLSISLNTINDVYCLEKEGLALLTNNQVVLGGDKELFLVDIFSKNTQTFKNEEFKRINFLICLENQKVLIGNTFGKLICFDISSSQILLKQNICNENFICLNLYDKMVIKHEHNNVVDVFRLN